ncbi:hypothetical protein N7453_000158 [Penicillium expansum]|nr:hypothetical protein N7453_000158 [Penicillium expansum]
MAKIPDCTKLSYPAPEMVDYVPNKIVGSHFGDFRLWQTVALKNLTSSMKSTIAFSSSGEWLAIPDGKYATLWNTSNRTAIRTSRDQGENIQDENENIQRRVGPG